MVSLRSFHAKGGRAFVPNLSDTSQLARLPILLHILILIIMKMDA